MNNLQLILHNANANYRMTFIVAKVNCLGRQPDVKQSFLAGFLEMKICNDF